MVDEISQDSWERVWEHAQAMWPRWKASVRMEALWRQRLSPYTEHRLIRAIEEVVIEHPVLTPRLAWVISKLRGSLSDVVNRRPQVTGFPATPEEADEAEREIIALLRAYPPSPAELEHGIKCWLFWKSGDWAKRIQIHVIRDAATPKPYEIWPQGLAGMVWAASEAAKELEEREEQQASHAVSVEYEPGAIEAEELEELRQGVN